MCIFTAFLAFLDLAQILLYIWSKKSKGVVTMNALEGSVKSFAQISLQSLE